MPDRREYAEALGYLVMASADLEESVRQLLGILLGSPFGTAAHILLKQQELNGLCDRCLQVAKLDFLPEAEDFVTQLSELLGRVRTAGKKRNDLVHAQYDPWWEIKSENEFIEKTQRVRYLRREGVSKFEMLEVSEIHDVTATMRDLSREVADFMNKVAMPIAIPEASDPHIDPLDSE